MGRSVQGAGYRPDRRLLFHEVQQQAQLGRKQSTVGEVRGRAAAAAGGAVPDQQPHPLVQGLLLHDQEDQGPVLPEVHLQPQGQHQEGNVHGGGEEQSEVSYATRFNIFSPIQEDMLLIIGVKMYGTEWAQIVEFLPNRTPIQLHSRWNSFLKVGTL